MKAVPKVNIDGLYLEDELVDNAFAGVVPFYAEPEPIVSNPEATEQPAAPEKKAVPEIAGYIVGLPSSAGLFRPRFDLAAWEAYQIALEIDSQAGFPELWVEGLDQDEIDKLIERTPQEPSERDLLQQRLVEAEVKHSKLAAESTLNQVALIELHQMLLKAQAK